MEPKPPPAPDFTLRPDHKTWRRLTEYLRRIEDAQGSAPKKNGVILEAVNLYLDAKQQNPGTSPSTKDSGKAVDSIHPKSGTLTDISSDLSETEKVYLNKCLGLLRSAVCDLFRTMVDAMVDQMKVLSERPRNHVAAVGAEIDRKLDAAEALAADALRSAREELRGTDSDAGGTEGGDRRGRKKPA